MSNLLERTSAKEWIGDDNVMPVYIVKNRLGDGVVFIVKNIDFGEILRGGSD